MIFGGIRGKASEMSSGDLSYETKLFVGNRSRGCDIDDCIVPYLTEQGGLRHYLMKLGVAGAITSTECPTSCTPKPQAIC